LDDLEAYQHGYGLLELENTALKFVSDDSLRVRTTKGWLLTKDDFVSLHGQVAELRSRFTLLYDVDMESAEWAPIGLSAFLRRGFRPKAAPWRLCEIDLASAPRLDTLLAVSITLSTLLREAKTQWQRAMDPKAGTDTRVPTFVVIDGFWRNARMCVSSGFNPNESDRSRRRPSDCLRKWWITLPACTAGRAW
jgi:hypothetical protein